MRNTETSTKRIEFLRDFFLSGSTFTSLDRMCEPLGYANRAGVRKFFTKLVEDGILRFENNTYLPTEKLTGYHLFESVRAGLPFTPETQSTSQVDLEKYLIEHPASTYFVRVKGDSMQDAGILDGDIVLLDRSRVPQNGDIVIASLEGDVTLKYLEKNGQNITLIPANPNYSPIIVDGPCEILGVVVGSVRKYR